MSNPYFKQTDPQYKLRWPKELRDRVAESAKEHNRSMNADIVARLEQSFKGGGAPTEREQQLVEQLEFSQKTLRIFMGYLEAIRDGDPSGNLEGLERQYPDWFKTIKKLEMQKLEQEKEKN